MLGETDIDHPRWVGLKIPQKDGLNKGIILGISWGKVLKRKTPQKNLENFFIKNMSIFILRTQKEKCKNWTLFEH